jgi:hypothetical protein
MTNIHCHLCGATLRRPEQFRELARPDRNDVIRRCRDEQRCATRATFDPALHRSPQHMRAPGASLETSDRRHRTPLGKRLTSAETEPIRVHQKDGGWKVDYGSYVQGYHGSREQAIEKATTAAARENRELTIEDAETTG